MRWILIAFVAWFGIDAAKAQPPLPQPTPLMPSDCGADEVVWTGPPTNARACTCKDLPELALALETSRATKNYYGGLGDELRRDFPDPGQLQQSRDAYVTQETTGPADAASSAGWNMTPVAWTHATECYTCVPKANLTGLCGDILKAAWDHEAAHRNACWARRARGETAVTVHGAEHAEDEAAAYEAGAMRLRDTIALLLNGMTIRFKHDFRNKGFAAHSEGEARFVAGSQDPNSEVIIRGKGMQTDTRTKHGQCRIISKPYAQPVEFEASIHQGRLLIEPGLSSYAHTFRLELAKPCVSWDEPRHFSHGEFDLADPKPFKLVLNGNTSDRPRTTIEMTADFCPSP